MPASYPTAKKTFTLKTNKVDLVDADHMNSVQYEVAAIEEELGVNPSGNLADLVTRLGIDQDSDGVMKSGTSFPGSPVARQKFYRTDLEKAYIRNNANTNWLELTGSNLSNLAFQYQAMITDNSGNYGEVIAATLTDTGTSLKYRYFRGPDASGPANILTGKYKKISGVNTATVYAELWGGVTGDDPILAVTIGGLGTVNVVGDSIATGPGTWFSNTIDVSGLTNDTVYDISIGLGKNANNNGANPFCGSIFMFNS